MDFAKADCIGWITVMEYCDSNLRKFLKNEKIITIEERKRMAIEVREAYEYVVACKTRKK